MSADAVAWLEQRFDDERMELINQALQAGRCVRPMISLEHQRDSSALARWPRPFKEDDLDSAAAAGRSA